MSSSILDDLFPEPEEKSIILMLTEHMDKPISVKSLEKAIVNLTESEWTVSQELKHETISTINNFTTTILACVYLPVLVVFIILMVGLCSLNVLTVFQCLFLFAVMSIVFLVMILISGRAMMNSGNYLVNTTYTLADDLVKENSEKFIDNLKKSVRIYLEDEK